MRSWKKFLCAVSIVFFCSNALAQASTSNVFSDVSPSTPYYKEIMSLYDKGMISGNPDGTFSPDKVVNRAEFLKMFISPLNIDKMGTDLLNQGCFPDVLADQWYTGTICYLAAKGFVGGYPDGYFKPANSVNYAESLKILLNTLRGEAFTETKTWYLVYFDVASRINMPRLPKEAGEYVTKAEASALIYNAFLGYQQLIRMTD